LQRDRTLAKGGADLHDGAAVAGGHALQRRHCAVHETQVGDLRDAAELLGRYLAEWREYRRECHIDPHVDRPEFVLGPLRGRVDFVEVRNIDGDGQRLSASVFDVGRGGLEACASPRQESDARPLGGELPGDRPPGAGAGPGHHHCGSRSSGVHIAFPSVIDIWPSLLDDSNIAACTKA
jgi:hypothetical protein